MEIKEMLRALLRAGYTEEAIAMVSGVNQSTISRILSGKIHDPRNSIVVRVSGIFNEYTRKNKINNNELAARS